MKRIGYMLLVLMMLLPLLTVEQTWAESVAGSTSDPAPEVLVTARYKLRSTTGFISENAVLRVYADGTSEAELHFNLSETGNLSSVPEDALIRLIRVSGVDGYYGESKVITKEEYTGRLKHFYAIVPIDRALAQTKHMSFAICKPDGTEKKQLRYELVDFTSANGKWPKPDTTPPVATIPPVKPTPTPTPRPTLEPGATEPPQDTAVLSANFKLRESTKNFTELGAVLRVYEEMSALTVQFKYSKEIADGTVMRMTMADSKKGYFGEGKIVTLADGTRQATLLFNQQVGRIDRFNLEAFAPGAQIRAFKAFYKLSGRAPAGWSDMDVIATTRPAQPPAPTPLPADVTPTPAPTEPPQKLRTSSVNHTLLDPVKHLSVKKVTHTRYSNNLSVLKIEFHYDAELPAVAKMRIVNREYEEGNFGEAIIEKGDGDLLTATIVTDQLQGSLQVFRLKCLDEQNNEQFYADFYVRLGDGSWSGSSEASIARSMLPTATPEPEENTPAPTITTAPTADPSVSPTPAPTEPPYDEARSKRRFQLLDKVKDYAHYNITLRRYMDFDVLTVYFRYTGELPDGAVMRLTQVDSVIDSYGEAIIGPANLKDARKDLLGAKIVSDRIALNCNGLRLKVYGPDGTELFTVDCYPEEGELRPKTVRDILNGPSPSPGSSESPAPTPNATEM